MTPFFGQQLLRIPLEKYFFPKFNWVCLHV
jgi:hypothetical protein